MGGIGCNGWRLWSLVGEQTPTNGDASDRRAARTTRSGRRGPARPVRSVVMHVIDREEFEALMREAVAELPQGFRERIENVLFLVEDRASADDVESTGTASRGTLLGVYRGVPLTKRSSGYNLAVPDVIVIFQQPLQRMARDAAHLQELVEHAVRHEVAHYFGISDRRLRELGAY